MAQQPRTVADNRRARFDYHLDETFDAGIVLVGSEVKGLRGGRAVRCLRLALFFGANANSARSAEIGSLGKELDDVFRRLRRLGQDGRCGKRARDEQNTRGNPHDVPPS